MQDKALIEQITVERAHGSPSMQLAWKSALESLPCLPSANLESIIRSMPSPEGARLFGRFLSREVNPVESLGSFLDVVDESAEPLEEWMKAFEVFAYHIESTAYRPNLAQATGYLHCCVSMAHTGSHYATLPMAVETMLETYGYSGESS